MRNTDAYVVWISIIFELKMSDLNNNQGFDKMVNPMTY